MTDEIITSPDAAVLNDLAETCGSIADEKGFREDWKAARDEEDSDEHRRYQADADRLRAGRGARGDA